MRFLYKVSRINLLLLAADLIFSCFQCSEANFTHTVKQDSKLPARSMEGSCQSLGVFT